MQKKKPTIPQVLIDNLNFAYANHLKYIKQCFDYNTRIIFEFDYYYFYAPNLTNDTFLVSMLNFYFPSAEWFNIFTQCFSPRCKGKVGICLILLLWFQSLLQLEEGASVSCGNIITFYFIIQKYNTKTLYKIIIIKYLSGICSLTTLLSIVFHSELTTFAILMMFRNFVKDPCTPQQFIELIVYLYVTGYRSFYDINKFNTQCQKRRITTSL